MVPTLGLKLPGVSIVIFLEGVARWLRPSGQDHAQREAYNPREEKGASGGFGDKLGALVISG
ncbi:hypothetical protein [Nitrobacter vulgaris]|uniref:hypothetical protein n=1 Tax=Nitrobacter vulgaris TaxID=29421 RepID=UPI0011174EE3|nr:hypothetical protein [Nitrobacter vulgaris]